MTTAGGRSPKPVETEVEGLRKKLKNLNRLLSDAVPAEEVLKMEAEFAKWKTRSRELNRSKFSKLETQLDIRNRKIRALESQITTIESELSRMRKLMDEKQ
ncbi:MAG: hypothetical protein ACE1ZC_03375 [Nitrososphaerales archaeon]|nr:hypothetical protein [Nitrososphaerota archaeon]